MDYYPIIASFFQHHLETASLAVDTVADVIAEAAEESARVILDEGKLFAIGLGPDCASAVALSSLMHRGLLRERPSLPVIELAEHRTDPSVSSTQWVSQQLRALGQMGDLGLVFAATLGEAEVNHLASVANQRQLNLIWFGSQGPGRSLNFSGLTLEAKLTMNQLVAVCLARLIDISTFGPLED
jgi:phosphoheptose isomerase